jgi:hypothetical protein
MPYVPEEAIASKKSRLADRPRQHYRRSRPWRAQDQLVPVGHQENVDDKSLWGTISGIH